MGGRDVVLRALFAVLFGSSLNYACTLIKLLSRVCKRDSGLLTWGGYVKGNLIFFFRIRKFEMSIFTFRIKII